MSNGMVRKAIEMAKMMAAMQQCEDTANYSLIANGEGGFIYAPIASVMIVGPITSVQAKALTNTADWSPSDYDAVRKAYLEVFMEQETTVSVDVAVPESMLSALYAKADLNDVPLDVLIISAMEEAGMRDVVLAAVVDCSNCLNEGCPSRH